MKEILIAGKSGAGKDEFAKGLANFLKSEYKTVRIYHFADLLKFICKNFYRWDGEKNLSGRSILQLVGERAKETFGRDCWAAALKEIISFGHDTVDYIIIPDYRFPEEYKTFPEAVTIKISRQNTPALKGSQAQHISENALFSFKFDYYIHNNGTREDLNLQSMVTGMDIIKKQWANDKNIVPTNNFELAESLFAALGFHRVERN